MATLTETEEVTLTTDGERPTGKRRTRQVHIAMPVVVRGKIGDSPFEETTRTGSLNPYGCMVYLGGHPWRGQRLSIENSTTKEERACTVISVGKREGQRREVDLEFAELSSHFWHISFPPEDWNPDERKLPTAPASVKRVAVPRHR